jgi:hypothetical protein
MNRKLATLALLLLSGLAFNATAQIVIGGTGPALPNTDPWIDGPGSAESDEDSGILFGDKPGMPLLMFPRTPRGTFDPVLPPRHEAVLPEWRRFAGEQLQ